MISPVAHEETAPSPRRPRFLVRDAADISRLLVHLVTHWTLPGVDVRVDRLPTLDSQRAQDRFVRLSMACNCLLGEILGAVTLLIGCRAAWVSTRGWRNLGLVVVATLAAVLIGKGIELAWTRVRLLLVLRTLRQRLAAAVAGRMVEIPVKVPDARPYRRPLNREDGDVLHKDRIPRPRSRAGTDRPRSLVRDVGDINRLVLHLVTRWSLPHIEIQVGVLPEPIVQRAQHRVSRLSAGYSYVFAGVLVVVSLLSGLFYIVWPSDQIMLWTLDPDWSHLLLVLIITLGAALIGCASEILWVRVRLLRVLLGLRRRMPVA